MRNPSHTSSGREKNVSLIKNSSKIYSDFKDSKEQRKKLWKQCRLALEKHHYFPLVLSFLSDFETPLSLCHKLKADFLLESVELMDSVGRYSIIASGVRESVTLRGDEIAYRYAKDGLPSLKKKSLKTKHFMVSNPLEIIQSHYLRRTVADVSTQVPPFCGGMIGYMGFEAAGYFEKLKPTVDTLDVPDVMMIFPELVAVYDNAKRMVSLIYLMKSPVFKNEFYFNIDEAKASKVIKVKNISSHDKKKIADHYEFFESSFDFLVETRDALQKKTLALPTVSQTEIVEAKQSWKKKKSNFSKKKYMAMVEKAKQYICAGDIFQVVLSQRFSFPCHFSAFEIYRSLRRLNPSPYLYYLNFGELTLVGSSPETMASLSGDELGVIPIAGTCPRGETPEEDEELGHELLKNEKELAEHLMLVDLGRNDLGRVARPGSVKLQRYLQIEKYSHVQHIVSKVVAEKKKDVDAMDVIRATFPAGTLSGAPKVRAMEIVAELEKEKRGPYGGMVFYLSLSGNFDSCITIRTLLLKDGMGYVQAGAGIVYDSDPASEYEECLNKSKAIFSAIEQAAMRKEEEKKN